MLRIRPVNDAPRTHSCSERPPSVLSVDRATAVDLPLVHKSSEARIPQQRSSCTSHREDELRVSQPCARATQATAIHCPNKTHPARVWHRRLDMERFHLSREPPRQLRDRIRSDPSQPLAIRSEQTPRSEGTVMVHHPASERIRTICAAKTPLPRQRSLRHACQSSAWNACRSPVCEDEPRR